MRILLSVLLFVVGTRFAEATLTTKPFQPEFADPILNESNWHLIEPLNEQEVYCGAEDSKGNLWFGSMDGLFVYDGYGCKKIPYPQNFQNLRVYQVYIDPSDHVYVSTQLALLKWQEDKEWTILNEYQQTNVLSKQILQSTQNGDLITFCGNQLYTIVADELIPLISEDANINDVLLFRNEIWVLKNDAVNAYAVNTGAPVLTHKFQLDRIPQKTPNKTNICFTSDGESEIWLLGNAKIRLYFDFSEQQFLPADELDFVGENHLWDGEYLTNEDNDLILFGKNITLKRNTAGTWTRLDVEKRMPNNNTFHFLRKNGNMIVGGIGVDLYEIDYSQQRWTTIQNLHFQCEDHGQNQWFLHENGSVIQYLAQSKKWIQHSSDFVSVPTSINVSSDHTIWVSGFHQNQPAVSYLRNHQWHTQLHPTISPKIHYLSFLEKDNGEILFGGTGDNNDFGGTVTYTKTSGHDSDYTWRRDKPPQTSQVTTQIAKTSESLWFAGPLLYQLSTAKGLSAVQIANSTATWVDSLVTDKNDNVWVGLWQDGLYKWDGNRWEHFTKPDHLLSDNVVNIAYDQDHNKLWIGHRKGVSLHLMENDQWIPNAITNPINLQREAATLKLDHSGSLWVNSTVRSWYLRKDNSQTDPSFHSQRFVPDNHPPLVWIHPHEQTVTEPANILIAWEGIDYQSITPQAALTFSYRIDDSPWSVFSELHSKIFLNIPTGKHTIEIRCRDLDGNISQRPAISQFEIKTSITKRPWFIVTLIITVLLILSLVGLLIYQRMMNLIRLEEIKLQFFTNISHELRSPLTVILGPLESFLKENDHAGIRFAHRGALKMLKLVDQILEFRKIEMGKVEHRFVHGDIIEAIRETSDLFKPIAEKKDQQFVFSYSTHHHEAWFDGEKIEKIVDNLLTNASKYTPENGSISLRALIQQTSNESDTDLHLIVEDNGVGIPENRIHQIFEPYERLKNKHSTQSRGTGLGLSFVKTLVESLNGSVEVTSPIAVNNGESCGTKFEVTIPLQKNRPENGSNESTNAETVPSDDTNPPLAPTDITSDTETKVQENHQHHHHLLIVEDDPDILEYLSLELQNEFKITQSSNGQQALKKAIKTQPDLIITDVMMMHMDGRQLCENIKSKPETSHIPVIMLTALKSPEHELHGLQKGADDYLTKPVNISILKQRIHNQLQIREQLRKQFAQAQQTNAEPLEITSVVSNSTDEMFLKRFFQIIQESSPDPLFDVETLSQELGMSRITLHRKIKSITGEPPSNHIRSHRLNKAAKLLRETTLTVSEISDLAGFNEVSYFSTSFKKHFGESPKTYKTDNK